MKKYYLLALFILFLFTLHALYSNTFAYQSLFKSNKLSFNSGLINNYSKGNAVTLSNSLKYDGFNYDLISSLSILGYKTFDVTPLDILNNYRADIGMPLSESLSVANDEIFYLDKMLYNQENLDINAISYYNLKYKNIKFEYNKWDSDTIHYVAQIYRYLDYLPDQHVQYLREVVLHSNPDGYNGYSGYGKIVLRIGYYIDDDKLMKVFYHEMGHIVDTGYAGNYNSGISIYQDFDNDIYLDDPSVVFYNVSSNLWIDRKSNSTIRESVSEYGLSNPYEDFAESYAFYISNGNKFRCLLVNNEKLVMKYMLLKTIFFNDYEYQTGDYNCNNEQISDVTSTI